MSHVVVKTSGDAAVEPSSRVKPVGRILAMVTTVCLSLSACETMENTWDSIDLDAINFFDGDEKADATGSDTKASAAARKHAVMRAGVKTVDPESVGAYMDQQEARLRGQLSYTGVIVTRVGETIILRMPGSKTFASGSSNVESRFTPVLDSVVAVLDEFNRTYVDVIGHTDSKGSKEYNQRLSEKRAKSVARYLESNEVVTERVMAEGMGEADPIATNNTSKGRAMNRRVEIKLTPIT